MAAAGRAPRGVVELVVANCRPQPAIPGVLVLLLSIVFPVISQAPPGVEAGGGSLLIWLVPVCILASAGLAVAAGFCSLFPQAAWIAVAAWALRFTQDGGPLPAWNAWVLMLGMAAVAGMFVVQLWRIRTGRFVATIRDDPPPV